MSSSARVYFKQGRRSESSLTPTASLPFLVLDAVDEADARAAVIAEAVSTFDGMGVEGIETIEENDQTGHFEGEIRYRSREIGPFEPGDFSESFNTTGATQHVTVALKSQKAFKQDLTPGTPTLLYNPAGGGIIDHPPFGQTIGYTQSEQVEGVDIVMPAYEWEETHIFAASEVTNDFKGNIFRLTGTMNTDDFKAFKAGENLFIGASGSRKGLGYYEISFRGAGSPNTTAADPIIIKGRNSDGPLTITVNDKRGWDVLWVYYLPTDDPANRLITPSPLIAVVDTVYREKAHAGLGIGT
jgi:hypothetical protein